MFAKTYIEFLFCYGIAAGDSTGEIPCPARKIPCSIVAGN